MALLDLAYGTGFVARAAARQVGRNGYVAGADINASMLAVAPEHAASEAEPVDWVQAPADALPFDDGRFDAVVCQQGLQFFPDVQAAASEAARVMRPGDAQPRAFPSMADGGSGCSPSRSRRALKLLLSQHDSPRGSVAVEGDVQSVHGTD